MNTFTPTPTLTLTLTPTPTPIPIDEYKTDPDLEKAVQHATDNCAPKIENTAELSQAQQDSLVKTMGMLNIGQCKFKKTSASVKTGGCAFPFGCAGAAAAGASQSSQGCEQINIISNITNQCTQQLSCMLNQVSSTSTVNVAEFQEITVELWDVTNATINLKNTSLTQIKTINIAQSSVQSAIGATLTQGLQSAIDQSLDITNEAFSDPTSQKNMQNLLKNLQSVASNTTINQSVSSTTTKLYKDQKIKLVARNISGSTLNLTNENVIDLISENYVYNALDQLFKSDAMTSSIESIKTKSKTEGKGIDIAKASSLDFLSNMFGNFSSIMIFVFVVIIVIIIIGVLLKLNSSKKKQQTKKRYQR